MTFYRLLNAFSNHYIHSRVLQYALRIPVHTGSFDKREITKMSS